MVKNKIYIAFKDFWSGFNPDNNCLMKLLRDNFDVELSEDPEFLIYSNSGIEHTSYNCTKIFYTGENIRPDFRACDYSIGFDYDDYRERNIRFPLYNFYGDINELTKAKDIDTILQEKQRFCNMVVSNPKCRERNDFFHRLSRYKPVDSGGSFANNIGGRVADKRRFIAGYKFTLAFENGSFPGYTTEKIFEPMLMGSIPIYWGNPRINTDFNADSFVNLHRFDSFDEAIEFIEHIDGNKDAYIEMLRQPWLPDNRPTRYAPGQELIDFFSRVFASHHSRSSGRMKNLYGKTRWAMADLKRRYLHG